MFNAPPTHGNPDSPHQKPPVGIDRNVALAADNLLAGVVAPMRASGRSLHRLAVDHPGRWAGLAPGPLTIQHQRHVVDGLEQKAPRQSRNQP